MESKFITPEELSKLQDLNNKRGELVDNFGIIELNIQDLKIQKEKLINELMTLKNTEIEIGNLLQQKYGNGQINLSTGEITF